ncbi:trypsin-like peptidase domain-containing protein [Aquimarina sp. ERC-38]|uniref:trypsin-like peptidase domain-containing protein n=1 Tax=Aquimarina sp. ERC-38 TaxID=2949996 RepID=UPI002247FD25|nr:trypsin-like peptidase domain-containing protein [Aquimarina sp. ERC-38]UZO79466.1 trypsin-like peptidase domain-containing protein [Aquimarina sp. ERC-38]
MVNLKITCGAVCSFEQLRLRIIVSIITVASLNCLTAQDELPRTYKPYNLTLSTTNGITTKSAAKSEKIIEEKGAPWIRVFFDQVQLKGNSTITLTSLTDNKSQTFNAQTLSKWQNSSAYLNGDKVKITITQNQGVNSSIRINKLEIGKVGNLQTKSQCGPKDNRIRSFHPAVGRIEPIGCTGWITRNGRIVTAGHCVPNAHSASLIVFKVPLSQPTGARVFPGPEDQYPINSITTGYVRGSAETDWAVLIPGENSQTGLTPIQGQNRSFKVVQAKPVGPIRIIGYGNDTGRRNSIQQKHTGPLADYDDRFVRYATDTEPGNSGSPIINRWGNVVGVHAYGGCKVTGPGSNFGIRSTVPAFWDAMGLENSDQSVNAAITAVEHVCDALEFSQTQVNSFADQDASGNFAIKDNGKTISLSDNSWKAIPYAYKITPQTILEVTFSSTSKGEVHAIGFEGDTQLSPKQYFKLYGTQNYGIPDFNDYPGSGTRTYKIAVGQYYTGTASTMVFINDNDAGEGNISVFSNIKVYEGTCGKVSLPTESAGGAELELRSEKGVVIGNEDEYETQSFSLYPNPVSDQFELFIKYNSSVKAVIYNLSGQKHSEVRLHPGVNTFSAKNINLLTGMYMVEIAADNGYTEIKKLIINN